MKENPPNQQKCEAKDDSILRWYICGEGKSLSMNLQQFLALGCRLMGWSEFIKNTIRISVLSFIDFLKAVNFKISSTFIKYSSSGHWELGEWVCVYFLLGTLFCFTGLSGLLFITHHSNIKNHSVSDRILV